MFRDLTCSPIKLDKSNEKKLFSMMSSSTFKIIKYAQKCLKILQGLSVDVLYHRV